MLKTLIAAGAAAGALAMPAAAQAKACPQRSAGGAPIAHLTVSGASCRVAQTLAGDFVRRRFSHGMRFRSRLVVPPVTVGPPYLVVTGQTLPWAYPVRVVIGFDEEA
jgi:hypothetical protein